MAIETLDDYNAQASCCCPPVLCPIPVEVCESISIDACGYDLPEHEDMPPEDACLRFRTRTDTDSDDISYDGPYPGPFGAPGYSFAYENHRSQTDVHKKSVNEEGVCEDNFFSGSYTFLESGQFGPDGEPLLSDNEYTSTATAGPDANFTGTFVYTDNLDSGNNDTGATSGNVALTLVTPTNSWVYTSPGIYSLVTVTNPGVPALETTFTDVITFSDPITPESLIDDLAAAILALGEEAWPGGSCASSVVGGSDVCPPDSVTQARTRWQIPATWTDPVTGLPVAFTGTYFLITYDILEEPDGWDDLVPTVFRSFLLEDQIALWTGPGTGDADDPSWFTDWITLDPPTVPGTRRIVNRRLVCRENWGLGSPVQVWGEGVELP